MFVFIATIVLLSLFDLSEQYCCQPAQWEGNYNFYIGMDKPVSSLNQATTRFSYDSERRMYNLNGTGSYNGQPYVFRNIQDYTNKVTYTIVDGKCTRSEKMPGPFFERCLDGNVTDAYIGTGAGSKAIHVYKMQQDGFLFDISVDDACVLIDVVALREHMMEAVRITNVTPGIKDPSVFKVPEICKKAKRAKQNE